MYVNMSNPTPSPPPPKKKYPQPFTFPKFQPNVFIAYVLKGWVWWHRPVILALRRLKGCIVNLMQAGTS